MDFINFGATVCKTVRPMLSDRCLSCPVCLSVLSVTSVYCGQTVGWIKVKLGMQVGLGSRHIVLDGDAAAPPRTPKGHSPQFSAYICCGQMAGWIRMPLGMDIDLSPGDFVLHGDSSSPSPKRGAPLPNYSAHVHCGQTAGCIETALGTAEQGMGRWVMGHGSNGSRKSDGSHGSWVTRC